MSKAFAEANARKKKQQQQQSMPKEQQYEKTFINAVNSRARERDNAVRSVQNLSQQIADNDRTGAYKGTLTDQHRRINDLSSLRTQLQDLRRNFGLDVGDTSDIDNAIKQQTKFVNAFKNDGEYRTGYWFGEKYKGSNKQQVQSAISSLEKGNDAQKGEALWLKQNQYQYWNSADLQKQMEANLAEAKRLQSLVNEVHGNAKSNRMKQYGGKIDSLKSEANAIRRALEAKAKEKEIMKLAPSEREMLTKYGEAAAKEDAYMSVSSANPVSRLIANASLPKETKKVIEDTEKMLRKKGYTPEQIRTLRDYSVKDYNAKSVQAQAEAIQKFADKSGWAKALASAGAIAADYVGGVQGVSDIVGQNLFGGKDAFTGNKRSVDYNSMFQQTGLAGEALKAGVTQDMGEFGKWAYGAGLSTIESLLGAYGMPGRTYELLMSGMAAQSAMQEMHRRGVDDGRVLGVGLAAGGLEALFEHASIENLRGIINAQKATGSGIKGVIERGLLQAGVEASEEGFTSLANTATELLALGDKSELKSNINLYRQQGLSEEEATRKAGKEWLDSVLQDTAAGFASGGLATMPASIGFAVNDAARGQDIIDKGGEAALIKEALTLGEKSPAYKAAQSLKDQLAEGQKNKTDVKLSASKLGVLQRKVDQQKYDDANSERAQIERQLPQTHESVFVDPATGDTTVGVQASRVAQALIASGESASVAVSKAPIIEKIVAGKDVTDAELKKMGVFSAAVAKVVNTYTGSDIDPNNASESELIKAYHAAAAQQKTRIDATVKMGEDIKAARAKLEAAQAEGEARLAQQETALEEETQAAADELAKSEPEQEQQSGSVIKVTNGDGTQVDMTLQDYIDSARQVNPDDPRSDAELAEEFNTLLGHAAMNGGTVRAEDVPNILRGASEAQVSEEAPAAEEEETTAEEEEPAAEEGTGEEETKAKKESKKKPKKETKKESKPRAEAKPKEEPAAEEPEAPVESAPKEKRPLGEQIAKDIYFLQEEGNEVKELKDEQIWAMQIVMPLLRQAGIKNLVVDETATAGANAFIDDGDGTIRINPKQMKSQIMILRILAHEIVHPATNDADGKRNNKAEKIIESFIAMYNQKALDGKLESLVKDYINGEAIKDARKRYEEFLGHSVSDHYLNQELASDMVGLVGDNRPVMEKLVGYQPDLMTKILRKINSWRNGTTIKMIKNNDQRKAAEQALDQIATDINNALRKSKLAAFQPKTKAQERADQRAEKLAAKAQKQNAERVSRVKERARTADTGESVAESASPENKSVAKAMARLNKGANRTRTARASLGLFPKDSNEHRAIEALGSGAEVTTNGDDELVLAKSKDNHTIMYSHATLYGIGDYYEAHPEAKSGIELLKQTLKANGHTDTEIAEVVNGIESLDKELGDLSEQIYQKYGWDEMKEHYAMEIVTDLRDAQQVIYTLTPNGEYPVNLDLALVCKKRVAYTRVLAQLVRDGVLDEISFGAEAIAKVNEILRDAGFETACLGCFVESRRTAIQNWAEDFVFEWNKVVDEINPNAGYFNFTYTNNPETGERENEVPALSLKDVAALDKMYEHNILNKQGNVSFSSSGPLDKVIELFHEKRDSDVLLKKLRTSDLMTPEGIAAMKRTDKTMFNLAKGRYGAAQPKVLQSFHPYAGDMTSATFEEVARKTGKDFDGVNQKSYRKAATELIKRKPGEDKNAYEIRMRELGVANLNGKEDKERRIDALAMRLYLYDIGGARIQSFSDFMIENTLDYLQIIADMSAARLPMHGYTKEIIAMKLFGMTGLKWNGSLIAHVDPAEDKNHAGLLPVSEASDGRGIILTGPARVENGKAIGEKQWAICFDDYDRNQRTGKPAKEYLEAHGGSKKNLTEAQKREYERLKKQESYIQSIGMKDIFALMMDPRYSKNIGNITIGVSDVQIIAMLRSDLFTMVIPYHKSGLPPIFAKLMGIENYNNYEDFQKTTVKQVYDENGKPIKGFIYRGGKAVHANTEAFNFNEALQRHKGNARAAAKDYIKWCKQKHPIIRDKKTIGYETFNPKFSSSPNGFNFAEDPLTRDYYYKLLEDFTALDPVTGKWTPQGPVQQYKVKKDGTYDLSKPLLPSENNRLTDEQKKQYRERLRGIGIYTEEEIDKIIQKSDMTFSELVRTEAENRGHYHHEVDPKFDGTYEEILEALSDPELRGTRAERDAERQSEIDKKAAEKAKKAAKKAAAAQEGKRLSIAGENSILADTDELDVAKNMEAAGNNADQIRIVTGWYRGPDGKWRYEIDDSRMQFHEKGSAKIWNDYPDYKDFYELEQKVKRGDSLTAEEQAWFDKAKKKFEPLREKLNKEGRDHIRNGTATLDEVLVHPELFAAYPDLRKIKFRVTDMTGWSKKGILFGQHDPAKKLITLNKKAPWTTKADMKERAAKKAAEREERKKLGLPIEPVSPFADPAVQTMRSTLLHEVQHAIQTLEGFARGTSPEYWEKLKNNSAKRLKEFKRDLNTYTRKKFSEWEKAFNAKDIDEMERIENEVSSVAYDNNDSRVTRSFDLPMFMAAINALRLDNDLRSDFELYQDTVGERESRDVQQRINLTPAQRRRYRPDLGETPVYAGKTWSGVYQPGPSNKTWNKPSGTKVRYSLPSDALEMDRQYMNAVESGDTELLREMVLQAAERAGWRPKYLYHGTGAFGFTKFDLSKMDDKASIFLVDDITTAETYSGKRDVKRISEPRREKPNFFSMNIEELVEWHNKNMPDDDKMLVLTRSEQERLLKAYKDRAFAAIDAAGRILENPDTAVKLLEAAGYNAMDVSAAFAYFEGVAALKHFADLDNEKFWNEITHMYWRRQDTLGEDIRPRVNSYLPVMMIQGSQLINEPQQIARLMRMMEAGADMYWRGNKVNEDQYSFDSIYALRGGLQYEVDNEEDPDAGNYELFAKYDDPLTIDVNGRNWNEIRLPKKLVSEINELNENLEELAKGSERMGDAQEAARYRGMMIEATRDQYYRTRDLSRFARALGYDSVVFEDIVDDGGWSPRGEGWIEPAEITIVFDPAAVKSADPITYDDNGDVIPLSERFNPETEDIRYSLPSDPVEMDRQYMNAVESGDTELLQDMVEEAARRAGYDSPKLYHGTTGFGFTQLDVSKSDDGISFFATDKAETASTYSGKKDVKEIGNKKYPTNSVDSMRQQLKRDGYDSTTVVVVSSRVADYYLKSYPELLNEGAKEALRSGAFGVLGFKGDAYGKYTASKFIPFEEGFTAEDYKDSKGNYQLYANTKGLLKVNADNAEWNRIRSPYGTSTRTIAKYAKEHGYSGVKIENVWDNGPFSAYDEEDIDYTSTVYIFFNPQEQVKSADPVTYGKDGDVIPLSERFNPETGDIRFSLPTDTLEMDRQYEAAVKSGDMETAQRMVDEAAARAGYTVRTYHGTPQEMLSAAKGRVSGDEYKALERDYADKLFPFVVFRNSPHHTGIYTATDRGVAEDFSFSFSKGGTVFDLYARAENPIVVDAGKNGWNNIPATEAERIGLTPEALQELREAHPKTRNKNNIFIDDLVEFAKSRGYDSVIVENVRETGSGDEFSPLTTDVVVLDSSQLKSADPVTYDDDGKVIPLSERFDLKNDDIRFALNPDLFLTDDYKTYYQELFSDKGLSPEAVKKARANARDENISRIATTYKNFFDANERRRKGLRKGDLGYVPDTNSESMQRAQDRLDADFQGEYENLKKNGLNTDDDVDAAMGILNVLVTDARNTKDYKDVADWLQRIRANATRSGQIVQAFAKYAQTPEGILIEAEEILAQTDLSKADQGIILAQLAQFATTLNAIKKGEEGNRDDLIDLILDQAAIRNTKVSNQTLKDLYRQKIDFLYDAALNQMSQIAQDYLKPSLAKGAATYQTISHLFNARTAARNVVSNTVFSPVAAVANNLAVVPDIIISLFTKQKTVGFDRWWFSGKTWKGVEEGARRAHVEIALDIDPRPNSRDKYGTSRRTWKMTGNAASRVGSTIEKAMGFELNWTDEFHKGAVEAEILQSLQGLVDKGVIREEDAEEWARQEALYRSFQDDTFLSARLQDIKNLLNTVGFGHTGRYLGAKAQTPFNEIKEFGLGDLIQKYTQVPGALITRAVEFSPIGYVKMIANLAQMKNVNKALRTAEMRLQEAQDELDQEPDSAALINRVFQAQKSVDSARFKTQSKQRMAALAMGRATTGVGLIKVFAMLAASGLLHRPDDDDDPDATAMLQSMGVTGTQLNVSALVRKLKGEDASWQKGDQLWAIDFLEPLNGLMTIGTKIIKEAKDDKTFKDKLDSAQRGTLDGLWNVIGEIPTMQSFSTIQQTLRYYDPEQWPNRATAVGIELARGSVTGFIPSLIRQTAQATDTVQRNTYTSKKPLEMTKDQIQNTLPYFRKKLPAKLDNYGQPRKQENPLLNALNAYVIPGSIRTYQVSPEAKELASVSKKTGDVNIYPDRNPPSKITVSVDGEDYSYNLSAKQKQTYQATRGKYSYQFQHDMMSDPFYKSATAQEKNAMLTEAKQLADYMAKKEFLSKQKDAPDYTDSSHEKTLGALANGYTVASWVDVRTTTNKAKGVDADGDGKADSGTKKKEQLGIIQSYDLNDTQKTYWFRGSDYNGSDSGRDYIGEAIDQHITPTKYIDAALKLLDAHGTDNNNDGKTDSGSVLKSKAAIINSLALTAEQKKWLFLQGNSKSTKFANSYNWTDTSGN